MSERREATHTTFALGFSMSRENYDAIMKAIEAEQAEYRRYTNTLWGRLHFWLTRPGFLRRFQPKLPPQWFE